MEENRIDFVKWLRVLMYIALAGLVYTLVGIPSFIPVAITTWISRILMAVMAFSMFKLAPVNDRYKKAGIQRVIVLVLTVVADLLHVTAAVALVTGILSIIADYQEYHGHSELIEEKDHQLSGKWTSLFMWSIIAGLVLGFTSTATAMFTAMAGVDTMKATILIAAILAIPQSVIEILYILYLKKMVAIFAEVNDGLETQ